MTLITQGSSASYTLTATQNITFTCDPGEAVSFQVLRSGSVIAGSRATAGETIGPYLAGDVINMTAQRGDVDYTVSAWVDTQLYGLTATDKTAVQALVSGGVVSGGVVSGATTAYAKPLSIAAFLAKAATSQARMLLTGTSIATFNTSALQILSESLASKYGRAGTVQQLGGLGGTYNAFNGYQKQTFCGSGNFRLVMSTSNASLTFVGWGSQVILVYSKEGGGSATVSVPGASNQTVDCSGSQAYSQELIFNLSTSASQSITINTPTGGNLYLERVEFIDRNATGVVVENATMGAAGLRHYSILRDQSGESGNLAGIAASGNNGIDSLFNRSGVTAADCVICEHFTNDNDTALFKSLLDRMLVTTYATLTPVVLLSEQPAVSFLTGGGLISQKAEILAALKAAANTPNASFLDWTSLVDYSNATTYEAKFFPGADKTHPSAAGMALPVQPLHKLFGLTVRALTSDGEVAVYSALNYPGALGLSGDSFALQPAPIGSTADLVVGAARGVVTNIGKALCGYSGRPRSLYAAPHARSLISAGSSLSMTSIAASGLSDRYGKYLAGGTASVGVAVLQSNGDLSAQPFFTFLALVRRVSASQSTWTLVDPSTTASQFPRIFADGVSTGLSTAADTRPVDVAPVLISLTARADAGRPYQGFQLAIPSACQVYGIWCAAGSVPLLPQGSSVAFTDFGPPVGQSAELSADQVSTEWSYVEKVGSVYVQKRATGKVARVLPANGLFTPIYRMESRTPDVFKVLIPSGYTGGSDGYNAALGGYTITGASGTMTLTQDGAFTAFPWGQTVTLLFRYLTDVSGNFRVLLTGGATLYLNSSGSWTASATNAFGDASRINAVTFTLPTQAAATALNGSIGANPMISLTAPASDSVSYGTLSLGRSACI